MHRALDDLSDPDRNLAESTGQNSELPEIKDLDLISEETSDNRIHTPPPRIAARFYRPTTNRRKSSAASSRRNSVSSAHSHQSAASRHGGPQSNFIAQHLRRASIIEDRKARLADRAAHAEKVRLRAAQSKAAPRINPNSEERALAAQQAREKNLAEIVAACAEEVKRAKGIAESMKEKREAEVKKLRRDMEERSAEAERRREEILNRGNLMKRGRSLSQPRKSMSPCLEVREPISEATAASRIQQKWRVHQRRKAVKEFEALGLTLDGIREATFDKVANSIKDEKVVMATAHMLRICGLKEGEAGSTDELTAARTFLSSFMILGHPTQVLSGKGQDHNTLQAQDLVAKARDLLISFENVLSRLTAANNYTPPPAQFSTLSESYATYYNAFIAWKARDADTMIDVMVNQFVELDSIWQSVKDSTEEAVTDTYRDGIRENQLKLMVRIKKLAGPIRGKNLITRAIREARKASAAKKPAGDVRPRAAESVEPEQRQIAMDLAVADTKSPENLEPMTPPDTPQWERPSHSEELRMMRPILPSNRILTHEVALDKDHRIEESALQERNEIMKSVYDSMRREIVLGNGDVWVLAMAENIKSRLQKFLPEGKPMHRLVGETLDLDMLSTQLQNRAFSYEKFFSFMGDLLPKLCAPVRDAQIKQIVEVRMQTGDNVSRLEALLQGIDLMQLDYANYMLSQSVPYLIKNAAEYEKAEFERFLKTDGSLNSTEAAWRFARVKVVTEAQRRDPENINHSRNRPTAEKVYSQMLIDVFTSDISIPETLLLDEPRITRIRAEVLAMVTTGAILLQCKNLLKRDVRSQWKTEASRVYSVIENSRSPEQATQGIQAALESSRSMPVATKNHIRSLVARVISSSSTPGELRDPVMRLLMTRLRGHILGRIAAGTEKEKVKSVSQASEGLATLGLPEFVQRVGAIVDEVGRVGRLDRECHASAYEGVAEGVEKEVASSAVAVVETQEAEMLD